MLRKALGCIKGWKTNQVLGKWQEEDGDEWHWRYSPVDKGSILSTKIDGYFTCWFGGDVERFKMDFLTEGDRFQEYLHMLCRLQEHE